MFAQSRSVTQIMPELTSVMLLGLGAATAVLLVAKRRRR
jgi:hypothetical protein